MNTLYAEWRTLAEYAVQHPSDEAAQDRALEAFARYLSAALMNLKGA